MKAGFTHLAGELVMYRDLRNSEPEILVEKKLAGKICLDFSPTEKKIIINKSRAGQIPPAWI